MNTITQLPFELWNSGALNDQEIASQLDAILAPHNTANSYPFFDASVKKVNNHLN